MSWCKFLEKGQQTFPLNKDVLYLIFRYLDNSDLLIIDQVCRLFKHTTKVFEHLLYIKSDLCLRIENQFNIRSFIWENKKVRISNDVDKVYMYFLSKNVDLIKLNDKDKHLVTTYEGKTYTRYYTIDNINVGVKFLFGHQSVIGIYIGKYCVEHNALVDAWNQIKTHDNPL